MIYKCLHSDVIFMGTLGGGSNLNYFDMMRVIFAGG